MRIKMNRREMGEGWEEGHTSNIVPISRNDLKVAAQKFGGKDEVPIMFY